MDQMVERPPHYTAGKIECIEAIESATVGLTGLEAYSTGNVIKYMWRWKQKGGIQDLKKAKQYIDYLIAHNWPDGGGEDEKGH